MVSAVQASGVEVLEGKLEQTEEQQSSSWKGRAVVVWESIKDDLAEASSKMRSISSAVVKSAARISKNTLNQAVKVAMLSAPGVLMLSEPKTIFALFLIALPGSAIYHTVNELSNGIFERS